MLFTPPIITLSRCFPGFPLLRLPQPSFPWPAPRSSSFPAAPTTRASSPPCRPSPSPSATTATASPTSSRRPGSASPSIPTATETVHYPFPDRLPADIVLASCEREDHNASSRLFGAPQAFRSVTGIGLEQRPRLFFRGTRTYLDKEQGARGGTNTVFGFTLDGIRIVHLGNIGHIPTAAEREEIGSADVLFLPVGNKDLTPADLDRIVGELNARIVVPICFKTEYSGNLDLRSLEEFLAGWKGPVKHIPSGEFTLTAAAVPKEMTLYVLDYPPKAQ